MEYELVGMPYSFAHKGFKIKGEFNNGQLLMTANDFVNSNFDKMSKKDIRECLYKGDTFEWIFVRSNIKKESVHDLEIGDKYYLVDPTGVVKPQRYYDDHVDRGYIKTAHAYPTEREANIKLQREIIEAELLALGGRVEFIKDTQNWFLTCAGDMVTISYAHKTPHPDVYFNSYEEADKAMRTVGKERILKYWLRVVDAK